jgi:hypothetical protein
VRLYHAGVETLAEPLAWLIVLVAPLAALGALLGAARWCRWLLRAGGALGVAGLVLTGVATVNLLVARTCSESAAGPVVQRPVLSAATGEGDCFRTAWGQLQLVALAGVGASASVVLTQARWRGGADRGPGAPGR